MSGRAVAPSILSADFARLGAQVADVLEAGARIIHVDVMDGHFVPPITMGPIVVSALRDLVHGANATIEVHLMIERPEHQVAAFADAGADTITIHAEATPNVNHALSSIREAGCQAGLAFCPATPPAMLGEVRGLIDVALCMTVNPGWGGQLFIPTSIDKIARMRGLLDDGVALEVDGGIDVSTAPLAAEAGANRFVAGTSVFGAADPPAAYSALAAAAGCG